MHIVETHRWSKVGCEAREVQQAALVAAALLNESLVEHHAFLALARWAQSSKVISWTDMRASVLASHNDTNFERDSRIQIELSYLQDIDKSWWTYANVENIEWIFWTRLINAYDLSIG